MQSRTERFCAMVYSRLQIAPTTTPIDNHATHHTMAAPSSKPVIITCRLLLILALAANTYLTTTELSPTLAQVNDKLGHILAYFSLALLADAAFPGSGFGWRKWLPLMLYGLLIEIIQHQLPYRQFSLLDLLANGGGLVLYGVVAVLARRRLSL